MKKFWLGLGLTLLVATLALAADFTSDEINLMNAHWGSVPRQLQLGTHLSAIETNTDLTKTLTSAHLFVGNASNVPIDVALSGDATLANTGALTIAASAVTNAKVSASAAIDFSKLATLTSGNILVGSAGNVATSVAASGDVTISNAGVTAVGAGKITEAMIKAASTANVLGVRRIARFTYDFAVNGGAVSTISLGVALPARSIITQSWIQTITPIVSTNNDGTLALQCETANNIFTATDIDADSAYAIRAGASDGVAANFKQITSACNISAVIAVHAFTAGKVIGWAEYVVSE